MKILFFGKLSESVGREVDVDVPPEGCTVAGLRTLLIRDYPHAREDLERPTLRACVEDRIVPEQFAIPSGATVEFFPPLSGG